MINWLEIIGCIFRENNAARLCCWESKENKSEGIADPCKEASLEITQMGLLGACSISAQDCTALKVADHL